MNVTKTIPRETAAENFKTILCSMSSESNSEQELIFPDGMIEGYCKQRNCPCYRFAHNLNGQPFMRARIEGITLEFLVRENPENGCKEAIIFQIFKGEVIYRIPENPVGTICIF